MNYSRLVQALVTTATEEFTPENVNDAVRAAYALGKKHGRLEPMEATGEDVEKTRRFTDTAQP